MSHHGSIICLLWDEFSRILWLKVDFELWDR
jgi:hypothetical protein